MALLDELPFVVPPEMAVVYRAAWPSSDLLAQETHALAQDARVLLLGCAADPLALLMARRVSRGECVVADDDAAAGQRLAQLSARVGLSNLRVIDPATLAQDPLMGDDDLFDCGLANTMLHPSKMMTLYLLRLGRRLLRPGAMIYVSGAKNRGVASITDDMRRLLGNVSIPLVRKGHRVASSRREPGAIVDDALWPDPTSGAAEVVTVRGARFELVASPLAFAAGRLDPAAAMLAAAIQVAPEETVVDLGCGAGIVGLVAARLAPHGHVYLLDASYAAARTALVNAERNAITNVTALSGDGPAIIAEIDLHPHVIVTNPPFHRGQVEARQVAARFIAAAAACLAPGGRLYVVANRFLAYEPIARASFADVREVAGDERYKVLLAQRPQTGPSHEAL
jgi:16S rRNA (guanine1207-N2)-methyltransferase